MKQALRQNEGMDNKGKTQKGILVINYNSDVESLHLVPFFGHLGKCSLIAEGHCRYIQGRHKPVNRLMKSDVQEMAALQ